MKEGHWTEKLEPEKTDVPKEDPIKYKAYHLAKALLSDGSEEYKLEQLITLFIQSGELADLRAELEQHKIEYADMDREALHFRTIYNEVKAERDKLKGLVERHNEANYKLRDAYDKLKADNERLKEYKENTEKSFVLAWKQMYDKDFTSELQRRWPSDEIAADERVKILPTNINFLRGWHGGIKWLKSYLEK